MNYNEIFETLKIQYGMYGKIEPMNHGLVSYFFIQHEAQKVFKVDRDYFHLARRDFNSSEWQELGNVEMLKADLDELEEFEADLDDFEDIDNICVLDEDEMEFRKNLLTILDKWNYSIIINVKYPHQADTLENLHGLSLLNDEYYIKDRYHAEDDSWSTIKLFEYSNPFYVDSVVDSEGRFHDLSEALAQAKKENNAEKMTKIDNEKDDVKMVKTTILENTLKNGVQVYSLEAENDFSEAQRILDVNEFTTNICAQTAYNARVSNDFVATYKVMVSRADDYAEFKEKVYYAQAHKGRWIEEQRAVLRKLYQRGLFESHAHWDCADDKYYYMERSCSCPVCSFRMPTMEEWQTGKYQENAKRTVKLGKALRKAGFEQTLIDFYSVQIKTEKEMFFTVSDLAQHIAGMSYYCEMGTWDGMGGSSCQDTRHDDEEYPMRLGGSLHDNKLFVGMLHANIDDVYDMEEKLIARTMMRYVVIDGVPCLLATSYYGNNETKDLLGNAISKLSECDIYDNRVLQGYNRIKERTNGYYEMITNEEVYVSIDRGYEQDVECTICEGTGRIEVWSDYADTHVECTCVRCHGEGTIEMYIEDEVREWVEVEGKRTLRAYNEGYELYEDHIIIEVDLEHIRENRASHGIKYQIV